MSKIYNYCVFAFVIFPVFLSKGQDHFDVRPENKYAMKGEDVTLPCTLNTLLDVSHLQTWKRGADRTIALSNNENILSDYLGKYQIEGSYNLVIPKTKLTDGELYSCENSYNSEQTVSAHLVILESDTRLTDSLNGEHYVIEGTRITYTCEINYGGLWPPVITWNVSGLSVVVRNQTLNGKVTSSIVFRADSSFHEKIFACETMFPPVTLIQDAKLAMNPLNYTNVQHSEMLYVYYSPSKIDILDGDGNNVPHNKLVLPGDELICFGKSNPQVSHYIWKSSTGTVLANSATVIISENWSGYVTLTCTAVNDLRGKEGKGSRDITIRLPGATTENTETAENYTTEALVGVNPSQTDSSMNLLTVIVLVVVPALLLLVVVVVVLIVLLCRWKKRHAKEQEEDIEKDVPTALDYIHPDRTQQVNPQYEVMKTPYYLEPVSSRGSLPDVPTAPLAREESTESTSALLRRDKSLDANRRYESMITSSYLEPISSQDHLNNIGRRPNLARGESVESNKSRKSVHSYMTPIESDIDFPSKPKDMHRRSLHEKIRDSLGGDQEVYEELILDE